MISKVDNCLNYIRSITDFKPKVALVLGSGLGGFSRQIAGVCIGVTFKEKKDGTFKVSVRTHEGIDAAQICSRFGGGGHKRAAGCQFACSKHEALQQMLPVLKEALA